MGLTNWSKKELVIFFCLIVFGAFLRLYALNDFPAGFHGDEGWTGIEARRILQQGSIGFWSPAALGQAALPYYWTAIVFKLLGASIFTARLSFALLGIFWLPFFYLFVRLLFSPKVAVVATFLLITGSTSLAFSRRADFITMSFPFFPSLFFFLFALKKNKIVYFILAGIFIGLLHHVYAAFWITPFVLFLFIIYKMMQLKKTFFKKYFLHLCIMFFFYLVVASPMLALAIEHPDVFFGRTKMVSVFSSREKPILTTLQNPQFVQQHILNTFFMFNLSSDPDIWNTFSHKPVLDPVSGIFFILGLFTVFLYWKKQKDSIVFLYLFFLFFLMGSIFTIDAPNFRRSQVSIYLSYIFVALGMVCIYNILIKKISLLKQGIAILGIISIVIISMFNITTYFYNASSREIKQVLSFEKVQLANYVDTLPKPLYIYYYDQTATYNYETLKFLLSPIRGEDRSKEFGTYSLTRKVFDKNLLYVFSSGYYDKLLEIQELYPNGIVKIYKDTDGSVLFSSYFLKTNENKL